MEDTSHGEGPLRSRTGCFQCRRRHQKCDEKQPICSFCARRDLDCEYLSGLKWVQQTKPIVLRHKPRNKKVLCSGGRGLTISPALFVNAGFKSPEEKVAWEYYFTLVSPIIPALDGPDNPYRKLSIIALSSPILLETILCIATEHMLNFGRGSVAQAAEHQERMLMLMRQSLLKIGAGDRGAFNYHDGEELLTAVVLQGIITAQRVDGVVEPHIKCASFLIQSLGHFRNAPKTPLIRMILQRFAMVDLMLAISRQRRPYAPQDFILYQPNMEQWDFTEPSFLEMTGCPQPLMCFLVQISHLACDVSERLESELPVTDALERAYRLEKELWAWGSQYTGQVSHTCQSLDILTECFYWTAHLLLTRRVFRYQTCSPRIQHLTHTCFRLMDHLLTGCGPDSSLPQPFYLNAREAITPEDRNWVHQKHQAMTGFYREQQRNAIMALTENIWHMFDKLRTQQLESDGRNNDFALSNEDRCIKSLDRRSCLFIF